MSESFNDRISSLFFEESKKTWAGVNSSSEEEDFRSPRYVHLNKNVLPGTVFGSNCDGIGTKVRLAEVLHDYITLGYDLIAMVCDDATSIGASILGITNTLDIGHFDKRDEEKVFYSLKELVSGLVSACRFALVPILNGEFGQMGNIIQGYGFVNLVWNASCSWIAQSYKIIDGHFIRPGDSIIAFRERGIRSNGFTKLWELYEKLYGPQWFLQKIGRNHLGYSALHPSRIYTPLFLALTGGYENIRQAIISGIIHVTGGGVIGRLEAYLKRSGYGAIIEKLYEPPFILHHLLDCAIISKEEAYRTWSMGNGSFVVSSEPEKVLKIANDMSYKAQVCGFVTKEPQIIIG